MPFLLRWGHSLAVKWKLGRLQALQPQDFINCCTGPWCLVKLFLFLLLTRGIIIKALSITKRLG